MNFNVTLPTVESIEKEYPYRYRWSSTLLVIIACGVGAPGMAWLAIFGKGLLRWFWWFGSIFMLFLFLYGLYIAVINLFGNRRLIITRDSIYLPSIWKSEKYTLIPFAKVDKATLINLQGSAILRLFVDGNEYSIIHSWLPSLSSFTEILQMVNERIKPSS